MRRVPLFGFKQPGSAAVLRIGLNDMGRDFVVGDIHGTYEPLFNALHEVGFIPGMDRLFCLGDLVDFGEASERCLEVLNIPGVYSVRGFREQRILSIYGSDVLDEEEAHYHQYHDGGAWWTRLRTFERRHIIHRFSQLPLAIQVETREGMVGLVHAEVPLGMSWDCFIGRLETNDRLMQFSALTGSTRIAKSDRSGVPGVWRLFAGSTVQRDGVDVLGNVVYIDTGAVIAKQPAGGEGYGLTMLELTAGVQIQGSREGRAATKEGSLAR